MPVKYISHIPNTVEGQAILDNFVRTRRVLHYRDNDKVFDRVKRGLPLYEVEKIESIGNNPKNLVLRGECLSACAYLKDKGIKVDLVYIDPPFASGADYAKRVYIRRNPILAEKIAKAEEQLDIEELRSFEEKMYGDIWNKEDYLNWMYENLMAIKSVMSDSANAFVHMDWAIGHYVKILLDEIFGQDNFVDEVIWSYGSPSGGRAKGAKFVKNHDTIYHYAKNYDIRIQNKLFTPYSEKYIEDWFKWTDENNRRYRKRMRSDDNGKNYWEIQYLDESPGIPLSTVWTDIQTVYADPRAYKGGQKSELDYEYATQKPESLVERIIEASSNDGMLVADFFGGSGVTAKMANDLKRNFIHVDVGVNSIQIARDRLKEANAEFDILDVKDGVSLFRNPVQTMDKLKSLITGLRNEDSLDSFWEGAINDSKLGLVPVYVPNLLDHTTKVLDIPLMNRIINEAISDLPDSTKQVIVYYIDIDDEKELLKFIGEYNNTDVKIVLRDLKVILDEVVINDIIEFNLNENKIEFTKFISDRLLQKIDEYNKKKGLNEKKKDLFNGSEENGNGDVEDEENEENGVVENANNDETETEVKTKKKKFVPIEISDNGLELIEMISLDCTNTKGIWKSDYEIKIDKNGYLLKNGQKTKEFWDGKIVIEKKPLRMKVRNIAGDETILLIEESESKAGPEKVAKKKTKKK